jgi:nucleotidyltransferase substrate binding protein (TIGR01987 family)
MNKTIRWKQRFQNLGQAFSQLQKGVAIATPNDIEKQGIIQSFEFTFELSWKTLKDYLESQNVPVQFPRDVIKQAFQYQIITDGDIWMDMLEKRNLMAHTYNGTAADEALRYITGAYFKALEQLVTTLKGK